MSSTGGTNTQYPDFQLIPPDEYQPIQEKALRKLAGLPSTDAKDVVILGHILGLDEVVTWKTKLKRLLLTWL